MRERERELEKACTQTLMDKFSIFKCDKIIIYLSSVLADLKIFTGYASGVCNIHTLHISVTISVQPECVYGLQ